MGKRDEKGRDLSNRVETECDASHWVGDPGTVGPLAIAVGHAAAAAVHSSTGLPVAVAFDVETLAAVSAAVKRRFPGRLVMVCPDSAPNSAGDGAVEDAKQRRHRMGRPRRFIRIAEVSYRTGHSPPTIYRKLKDPESGFPDRVRIGANSVGWFEDEIDAYMERLDKRQEARTASRESSAATCSLDD